MKSKRNKDRKIKTIERITARKEGHCVGKLSGTALSEKGQSAVWCCSCCPRVVRDIAGAGPVLSKILQVLYPGVRDIAGAVPALSGI